MKLYRKELFEYEESINDNIGKMKKIVYATIWGVTCPSQTDLRIYQPMVDLVGDIYVRRNNEQRI